MKSAIFVPDEEGISLPPVKLLDANVVSHDIELQAQATELGEIGNMLSGIMIEAGQGSGMTLNFDTVNEDASKILSEAATVAEQKVKDKFPDLPAGIPSTAVAQTEKTTESY